MSPSTDTKTRIIDSARRLIHGRSYGDVGVAEICDDAGVKKGSFYHFFPSKCDLTVAILELAYADLKQDLLDHAFANDVTPMQRMQRFVEMNVQFQIEMHKETGFVPGCPFGNIAAEQATQDDVLRSKVQQLFQRLEKAIRETLVEAVSAGEVGDIDVDATAAAMLAYLEGVILMAKTQNDPGVMQRLMPPMLDIRIGMQVQ